MEKMESGRHRGPWCRIVTYGRVQFQLAFWGRLNCIWQCFEGILSLAVVYKRCSWQSDK